VQAGKCPNAVMIHKVDVTKESAVPTSTDEAEVRGIGAAVTGSSPSLLGPGIPVPKESLKAQTTRKSYAWGTLKASCVAMRASSALDLSDRHS